MTRRRPTYHRPRRWPPSATAGKQPARAWCAGEDAGEGAGPHRHANAAPPGGRFWGAALRPCPADRGLLPPADGRIEPRIKQWEGGQARAAAVAGVREARKKDKEGGALLLGKK